MNEESRTGRLEIADPQKVFFRKGNFGEKHPIVALEDVNLTIEAGEFVTVIGPSGSGKSTLLMIIAGLVEKTSGDIRVDGRSVRGPGLDRGVVFQDFALFPWLTVTENVRFGIKHMGMNRKAQYERVDSLIDLVGLAGFEHSHPHQLSGGMKQRVAIARALAYDPQILLMDEPFGALDAQTRSRMQQELQDIWMSTGKTVLFVTHSVRESVFLSDRVVVLSSRPGRIVDVATVDLPRPRDVFAPEFAAIESRLAAQLAPGEGEEGRDGPSDGRPQMFTD